MKKIIKNPIFTFILGAILFSSITVFASSYLAKDISFTPKNTNWKKEDGTDITNVKDAIDDLYGKANEKVNIGTTFQNIYHSGNITATNSISLELNSGKYLCDAVFSAGALDNNSNIYSSTDGYIEINDCDTLNEINELRKFQSAANKSGNAYLGTRYIQTLFTCIVNERKTINVLTKGYTEDQEHPVISTLNCTKLD